MEKLKESLENLHKELQNSPNIDEESTKILKELMADIQNILERDENIINLGTSKLLDPLKESAGKLEVSHPNITSAINIVISSLTNIGV